MHNLIFGDNHCFFLGQQGNINDKAKKSSKLGPTKFLLQISCRPPLKHQYFTKIQAKNPDFCIIL